MTGIAAGKTWSRIGPEVAPSSGSASGVWTLNELAENEGAGSWPEPLFGSYEWLGGFNFSSASTSIATFSSLQTSVYGEYVVRVAMSKMYIAEPMVSVNNAANNTVNRHSFSQDGGQVYGWSAGSGNTVVPVVVQAIQDAPISWMTNLSSLDQVNIKSGTATQAGAGWSNFNISQTQETGITYNPSPNPITSIYVMDANGRQFEAGTTINLFGIKIV